MEKIDQEMMKRSSQEMKQKSRQQALNGSLVWDCGSTLYDSFELKSFERQLDSAIHSRTMSMPHLPDRRVVSHLPPPPPPQPSTTSSKKPSKISRSLQKFIKSVFKSKQSSSNLFRLQDRPHEYYMVFDKSGALSTIPEVPEIDFGGFSPDSKYSLVKRTTSERFPATASIGISCA